jgi:hypothetical protein
MNAELKPCPKCGSLNVELLDYGCVIIDYNVICSDCFYQTDIVTNLDAGGHGKAIKFVTEKWNASLRKKSLPDFMST